MQQIGAHAIKYPSLLQELDNSASGPQEEGMAIEAC